MGSSRPAPAVVFDFGGVLLHWDPRHLYRKLFQDADAMERFLAEIGFAEWNLEQDRGRPFAVAVAELSRRFPQHAELIAAYEARWEESIAGPIAGSVEVLARLRAAGHALYGLSNWSAETFRRIRPRYAFFDWFLAIVISGEVGLVKPDPRIFRTLLDRVGRPAAECLFIDDGEANIAAATGLGFQTVLFESPEQLAMELGRRRLLRVGAADRDAKPPLTK
ncbi:MAG: HAD family hydrolase [Candidatus Methylomirabilales bacterium]